MSNFLKNINFVKFKNVKVSKFESLSKKKDDDENGYILFINFILMIEKDDIFFETDYNFRISEKKGISFNTKIHIYERLSIEFDEREEFDNFISEKFLDEEFLEKSIEVISSLESLNVSNFKLVKIIDLDEFKKVSFSFNLKNLDFLINLNAEIYKEQLKIEKINTFSFILKDTIVQVNTFHFGVQEYFEEKIKKTNEFRLNFKLNVKLN